MEAILQALTPTLLTVLIFGLYRLGRMLIEIRQDGRETKEHLRLLNGQVKEQHEEFKAHEEKDAQQFSEIARSLYTLQGRIDARRRDGP